MKTAAAIVILPTAFLCAVVFSISFYISHLPPSESDTVDMSASVPVYKPGLEHHSDGKVFDLTYRLRTYVKYPVPLTEAVVYTAETDTVISAVAGRLTVPGGSGSKVKLWCGKGAFDDSYLGKVMIEGNTSIGTFFVDRKPSKSFDATNVAFLPAGDSIRCYLEPAAVLHDELEVQIVINGVTNL